MATGNETSLTAQVVDLRAEGDDLYALLTSLTDSDWNRATAFKQWTVYDALAHLHFSDHMGATSLRGTDAFKALMRDIAGAGLHMTEYTRRWLGALSGRALLGRWRHAFVDLCDRLEAADPQQRLAWAGPGMKPRMFITARQMETWAHGSEIYDVMGVQRVETDRLRNIATIGVKTYLWTFANRKLPSPGPAPHVRLIAPSGAIWEWNDRQAHNRVAGTAVDFCHVVTQVRNTADTQLDVVGAPASQWMAIAQCFAGPPENPPAPGSRVPRAKQT